MITSRFNPKRVALFACLMLVCMTPVTMADVNYPSCSGGLDCIPQCGSNCAPPGVPCPQAGTAICGRQVPDTDCTNQPPGQGCPAPH